MVPFSQDNSKFPLLLPCYNHYVQEGILLDKLKNTLRALSYRNYRLFFIGQGLSLIGTWMQNIALAWLVYRLTNSAFWLGMVGFLSQIMIFVLSPIAGAVADRFNRRHIMVWTQALLMLQAFILAALYFTGSITVWQIMLLSVFLGLVTAFDTPARQAYVIKMVEKKEDLGNAIALNSSLFNSARLIGPSIAGLVIALAGEGICFLINGVSYMAVIISLLLMNVKKEEPMKKESHILKEMKEGLAYAYRSHPIRSILLLLGFNSFIGMSYTILMPVFASEILHGGPQTLGFLMGSTGIGALIGAFYLASRKSVLGLANLIATATFVFGISLMAFAFSTSLWLSLILVLVAGFGMMLQMASCNTIVQTIVEEKMRGRVMSLYVMAFLGMAPFGSLLAGSAAHYIGVPSTIFFSGLYCLIGAVLFSLNLPELKKAIRPIYIKMGIIPEMATAIGTVSQLEVSPDKK